MRIFLASLHSLGVNTYPEEIKKINPKYILMSFADGERNCLEVLGYCKKENFLLDSGAFSYMNGKSATKESLEEYLEKYIEFINKYDIKYFFQLDIERLFGMEYMLMLTERLEKKTGKKCIPVWRNLRGVEHWKYLCDNYKYIAIGDMVLYFDKKNIPFYKKLLAYAKKRGVKVHGLGFTKTSILQEFDFYSVDSTSWKMCAIRGNTIVKFKDGRIKNEKNLKSEFKLNQSKIALNNLNEWVKYQKYMDRKR